MSVHWSEGAPQPRNIPRDLQGGVNEWKALVKHYEGFDTKATLLERAAKGLVQETVKRELTEQRDQQLAQKKRAREEELAREREILALQRKRDEEAVVREMAAKKAVQQLMGEQYRMEMEQRRTLKEHEFARNRQHETAYVQKSLAETDPERLKKYATL